MRAGDLDRQITVQRKSVTLDATYGTEVITWVPLVAQVGSPVVAERFQANVQDVLPSRQESMLNGDIVLTRKPIRIRLRWRNDIDATMRVIIHGETDRTTHIIGGPAEIGSRKDGIEFVVEEISS